MLRKDMHGLTVNEALYELNVTIKLARNRKEKLIALIVGYGASGKSHKIKSAFIETLTDLVTKKQIRDYILGSDLDLFNPRYLNFKYRDLIPNEVKRKANPGEIYIII